MPKPAEAKSKQKKLSETNKKHPIAVQPDVQEPRRLKLPAFKPFRWRRIRYPEQLPSVWSLTGRTFQLFAKRPKLFIGICLVYILLILILVQGLSGGADIVSLKNQLSFGPGSSAQLLASLTVLATLFVAPNSSSGNTSGAYQLVLGLIISLATIWAARQTLAGQTVRLREAFYQGVYPLVPFVLVLLVVILQTLPLLVGTWLYATVVLNGVAATGLEQLIWGLVCIVLAIISLYMLCSSLFALYIVTLPNMTPMKALRSARQLVRYRRGPVFRKLLFLPVLLLVVICAIMLPIIIVAPTAATWIFFILTSSSLIFIHLYMYTLYKALLA